MMKSIALVFASLLSYPCNKESNPQQTAVRPHPKVQVSSKEPGIIHSALDSFPGTHQFKLEKRVDRIKAKFIEYW